MAWTENGPVSTPPRSMTYAVAGAVCVVAIIGAGLGFRAAWRDTSRPALGSIDQQQATDQAVLAKPIVDITSVQQQAAAAPATSNATVDKADETADSNAIAAKTAAVQAVQSRPSQTAANIDDILTSQSEKPQAPAKPSTDEQAPKTDVPF
jgi:hypothetical protein